MNKFTVMLINFRYLFASLAVLVFVLLAIPAGAQTVPVPTQTDQITRDQNSNGKADPGDTIRYKVTIQNTGGSNATGVKLNAIPDSRTTLTGNSFRTSPLAVDDGPYSCIGNVGITVPAANGLKANDYDDNPAGLTVAAVTNAPTTSGGQITILADGSFSYMPPRGFKGTDTYIYTLEDGNEVSGVAATNTGTVTITISDMIWFVDENQAINGDGRLGTPFNSLTNYLFGGGSLDGDIIFLYSAVGQDYNGGIALRPNQKLIGQGATVSLAIAAGLTVPAFSNPLPATNGARPVITNTNAGGRGISLASLNTIRGLNVGNCMTYAIDDNGDVGTLTITEVDINNTTGGGFRADNGGTLAVTLGSVTATNGGYGIYLSGTSGSFSVTGASTFTNNLNHGIRITNTSTNASFGSISITGTISGSECMELNGNSGTFSASGTTTINSPNTMMHSLHIIGGTGSITFAGIQIGTWRDRGIRIAGGSRNITTGAVTINTGISSSPAIEINAPTGGTISFGDTDIDGNGLPGAAIDIQNNAAAVSFATGSSITNCGGVDFNVNGGSANITYNGSITNTSAGTVSITGRTSGTVNLQGNISSTTAVTAISCSSNTGGTIIFSGSSKSITSSTVTGVNLANNTGATINFTNGGLVVTTTSGTGFNATGGGTISVQGSGNTINSSSGATALNVANTTIGSGNLNFQSISSSGGTAAGIILNATGTSGGLVVTGAGTAGSGGTIANKDDGGVDDSGAVGTAIFLTNTSNVSLSRMQINDCKNFGIRGLDVGNFTLQNSVINGSNGDTNVGTEDCIGFGTSQPVGANGLKDGAVVTISNCTIQGGVEHNIEFYNIANTFTVTISNCSITNNSVALGGDGIQIELHTDSNASTASASGTFSIQDCTFDNNKSQAVQAAANGDSFIDITINNCTLQRTSQGNEGFVLSNGTDGDLVAHVTNNTITGIGGAVIFVGQTAGNATASSSLTAVISGNTITHPTSSTNSAIIAFLTSTVGQVAPANVLIHNNTVTQNSTGGVSRGIFIDTPDANTTPSFTATVTNNTVHVGDGVGGVNGIATQCRRGTGCFDIRNNTVDFPNGNSAGIIGERARQVAPGTYSLERGAAALADPPLTVLNTNNPATTNEVIGTVTVVENNACANAPN